MQEGLIAAGPKKPRQSKTPMILTVAGLAILSRWERRQRHKDHFNSEHIAP
jgi:hypothetical protein